MTKPNVSNVIAISLITQPENEWYLIIKPAYYRIGIELAGNKKATARVIAGLLNILEIETKVIWERRGKPMPMPDDLWVWKTYTQYKKQLFGIGGNTTIMQGLKLLFRAGLIDRKVREKKGAWVSYEYRLCLKKLQKAVDFPSLKLTMTPEIPSLNSSIPVAKFSDTNSIKDKRQVQKDLKDLKDSKSLDSIATENTGENPKPELSSSPLEKKADDAKQPKTPKPQKQLFNAVTHTLKLKAGGHVAKLCLFFEGKIKKGGGLWQTHQGTFKDDGLVTAKEMLAFGWWVAKHQGGYMPETAIKFAEKFELFRAKPEHDDAMQHAELYIRNGILETTWEKRPPRFGGAVEIIPKSDKPGVYETPEQIAKRKADFQALMVKMGTKSE